MAKDLFEHYETLPSKVRHLLDKHANADSTYESCERLIKQLEKYGYTCEYGLDAVPYGLKKLTSH